MISRDLSIFIKIPTLNTERITLRRIKKEDINDVYQYSSDPLVPRYLLWYPHPDKEYTEKYLAYVDKKYKKGEFYDWAIELEGKMIGTCGFSSFDLDNNSAEIGYVLNRNYWNKGYATECARAVMKFGFEELGLWRITARFMPENTDSERVLKKLNMRKEGYLIGAIRAKGRYKDVVIYAITKDEYDKLKTN